MLNQTFSLTNFEDIYDEDNRKGRNQDEAFFPEVVASSKRLATKTRALKAFKKRHTLYRKYPKDVQKRYDALFRNVIKQRKDRESRITSTLSVVAQRANRKSFRIGLTKNSNFEKDVFERDTTPESYYALRQITRNIRSLYKTKPADRNQVVSKVQNLLQDNYPYVIIRTDIANFFESVDQKRLVDKLVQDQLLSTNSIKLIKQILWDYSLLSGTPNKGIPRGLSISSDLAELFLKVIDRRIQQMDGVAFYARYVDDIFLLISPNKSTNTSIYLPSIKSMLSEHGLTINEAKTKQYSRDEYTKQFDYLGYEFTLRKGTVDIDITNSKHKRIRGRIDWSFKAYEKQRHKNPKGAYRLILKRIKFLSTNTRLVNSKGNAFVGIFFGNPNLTSYKRLTALDKYLANEISKLISQSLKEKLTELSFVTGHREKTYSEFNRHTNVNRRDEFSQIVEVWRHDN
ncbi:MAG: antiviral reverse transcriptase Drt3a [Roseibium sp.]